MKSLKLTLIMRMAQKEQIVNRIVIILFACSVSVTSLAQEVGKQINNKLVTPIIREISTSIKKNSRPNQQNCKSNFFSIKFIVNIKTKACDTVIYSKSVPKEVQKAISNLIKGLNFEWLPLENADTLYEIILPIHLSFDKCPIKKYSEVELWDIFTDLLISEKRDLYNVIILSPVNAHISTN